MQSGATWVDQRQFSLDGLYEYDQDDTGAAALYLSAVSSATPAQTAAFLSNAATGGGVRNPQSGSPNLLLYTLAIP